MQHNLVKTPYMYARYKPPESRIYVSPISCAAANNLHLLVDVYGYLVLSTSFPIFCVFFEDHILDTKPRKRTFSLGAGFLYPGISRGIILGKDRRNMLKCCRAFTTLGLELPNGFRVGRCWVGRVINVALGLESSLRC